MYKLVAIDLDGTLLNSYGEISEKNKEALKYAKENGAEVILASGRGFQSVKIIGNELDSKYIICGNGAVLYDMESNEILYDNALCRKKALEVIKICEENSIYYNLYTDNNVIAKSLNYNVLYYNQENNLRPESQRTNINIVNNIYEYIKENENLHILKMTICDGDKIIFDAILRKLKDLPGIDVLDVEHMSKKVIQTGTQSNDLEYFYTEITSPNVNKWNALSFLADKLNISSKQIMAIGDNINDLEMIKNAGCGVIMGNSAPYLQPSANLVVSDNNNDGVSEAIYKYIKS